MIMSDLRELTDEELVESLKEAKNEKFNLRFQVATNQLDNTARIKAVKREIARMLTVMRERERASSGTPADAGATGDTKESA